MLAGVVLALTLAAGFLLARRALLDRRALASDYQAAARDPGLARRVQLAGFPLRRQAHAYSCGPATITMVVSYLEAPLSEEDYAARAGLAERKTGMLPRVFLSYLRQALPARRVELVTDRSPLEVLQRLHSQLAAGLPVPVYFSTVDAWVPARSDTHYSVATGLDLARGFVHIANAYGFEEDVPLPAFFERLALANHWSEPFAHRLARLTGYVAKNHLYVISPGPRRE